MKKVKFLITMTCLISLTILAAQTTENKQNKFKTVVFQVNATCMSCKNKIESHIAYEKGVKDVNVDLQTSQVTIVYNPQKNTAENLQKAIQKLGYTAQTPSCCQKNNSSGVKCTTDKK